MCDLLPIREQLPEWLRACVEEFEARYGALREPPIARGKCWRASLTFLQFVCDRMPADCEALAGVAEATRDPHYAGVVEQPGGRHYVTQVAGYAIDWTARQFRPGDDFPRIWVPDQPLSFYT